MSEVSETHLPGVGVRHEFDTQSGRRVGVVVHRTGQREVVAYDRDDPDACSTVLDLSPDDSRTIAELLGASQVTEAVAAVQHDIEGLGIEWMQLPNPTAVEGTSIRAGEYRTKTGVSIVAVIRDGTSIPAPDPEFAFAGDDVVVAVGTTAGLAALRALLVS